MKYITIVLFILSIQVAMALVNATNIFDYRMLPHEEWWSRMDKTTIEEESYVKAEVDTDYDFGIGDLVKAIFLFVYCFAAGVVVVPYMFATFGLVSPYIYILSLPVYAMYLLGWIQFLSNRSTSQMR